jgi:hypothetical protein
MRACAAQVEAFIGEQSYQERRGPAAKDLKDDQLFFVDTVRPWSPLVGRPAPLRPPAPSMQGLRSTQSRAAPLYAEG